MQGNAPIVLRRDARASSGRLRHEWRGWLLALCIVAAHLAGAGHRAFERHVLCADHGEWTHEDACTPVHDGHEHHAHQGDGHHCEACPEQPLDQEHEHCLLATMARLDGGTPPPEPVRAPSLFDVDIATSPAPAATIAAALAPLDFAPKQSPPAV